MNISDPVSDLLARLRNALSARHEKADIPSSRFKVELARILKDEGYIKNFKVMDDRGGSLLRLYLKYDDTGNPVIHGLARSSKPGRRLYAGKNELPEVLGGLGVAIVSTSQGLLTGHAALFRVVAGEETLRGGHNGDAEAAENLGKLVFAGIEAPTRLARAREAVDDGIPGVVVLEVQAQQAASPVVHHLEVLDIALVLEDASELDLEARRRNVGLLVPGRQRVPEAREEIGDGIADVHRPLLTTTPSSPRARSPRARGSGSKCGTSRTCGETPADARSACNGFACGSRISVSNSP